MVRGLRFVAVLFVILFLLILPLGGNAAPPDRLDPTLRLLLSGEQTASVAWRAWTKSVAAPTPGSTDEITVLAHLTTDVKPQSWLPPGARVGAQVGDIASITLPLAQLADLAASPWVRFVQANYISYPLNDISIPAIGAPFVYGRGLHGKDVLVGIIDTGIDWTHPDFRDEQGKTRIKALLDLSDPGDRDGDGYPDGLMYGGTLYTASQIDAALIDNGFVIEGDGGEIPDNNPDGITLTVDVTQDVMIHSLAVSVRIRHPYRGDLQLNLISPQGAIRPLVEASRAINRHDIFATYEANEFDAKLSRGVWRLHISDLTPRDIGVVEGWSLHFNRIVRATDRHGHGTHVAGTAAGNGLGTDNGVPVGTYAGVAPAADLIVVKATRDDSGFTDDDQLAALDYIERFATAQRRPVVANLSLGSQWGAHDGTSAVERAIDRFTLSGAAGRAVAVAAGNDGTNEIHAAAMISGRDRVDMEMSIPPADDYFIANVWFEADDRMRIGVRQPNGAIVLSIAPGGDTRCVSAEGGAVVCLSLSGPSQFNGAYNVHAYLTVGAVRNGWALTVEGESAGQGRVDAWAIVPGTRWTSGVDSRMRIATPGTTRGGITVGAYITRSNWLGLDGVIHTTEGAIGTLAPFSSDGPTRDGRLKPDVSAPGQSIMSSLSRWATPDEEYIAPDGRHHLLIGTSMATPHVTGAIALLFQANPTLTTPELRNYLTAGAYRDSVTGFTPNPRWGAGRLNVGNAWLLWFVPRPYPFYLPLLGR